MLDSLRKAAGTWIAKLLLLLLVLSFAVWGISGQIAGGPSSTVVTAGETTVSALDYRLAYDRQLSVLSQRFGSRITREQAIALGVDAQVLAQLVAGAVLDEQAREMGLGLSQDRLALLTAEDPAFRGPDGTFDRRQFEFVLQQIGMRPEDYIRNREQVAIRQQIVEAVSDGMSVPDTFLKAVALYQGEDRTVDMIVLPPALVEPIEDPSDDVLAAWFEDNKIRYEAPEYRKLTYVKLEPEDIADPRAIADDQVRQDYETNIASYTTPERRTIEQVVFANTEAAQIALDRIRGGATFEETVAAEGKSMLDVQLGTLEKSRVADPAVAEAAFGLAENEISGIVEGAFGPVILRVTEIEEEKVQPFEEVADKIRMELALAEAGDVLFDVHDGYEDARASGATMAEAAEKLGLKMVTVEAIDRTGRTPDGTVVNDLPQSRDMLREAFETEAGVENPPLSLGASGFVFYEVDTITPRRERSLDEVRDEVVADWRAAERDDRLSTRAKELEKRIADGASLDEIAGELALEKQTKRGLRRGAEDADFGAAGVAAVYGVAPGGVGTVAAPTGDAQILFKVVEVFEPAGASAESVPPENRENFRTGLADDLLDQLVTKLRDEYGVTVNQAAIQQALSF
ncbi:SurA N-terminal domain-containing protein [Nitratireductor sp. StC3]|uniref:SurA N-terminal domain-containing protein n=1 Tax=Nitratireductor sp. StC3 TaxID=2126741 RepID=UPI000D0D2EB0|nr:SurA N-terminal domain-containing protein [Nitratireductor sp. StC3]PSM19747.1 peptidylprolyl isomerase [Nitratireductor sp. StC3]